MPLYQPNQLPPEHQNAPLTHKGIIATFHASNGKTYDVKFEHDNPVKLGSRFSSGFLMFGMGYVWDGTYQQPYYSSNDALLQNFCEGALNRGFFNFQSEMVPFMDITKITKKYYDYKVPLDTDIFQGD